VAGYTSLILKTYAWRPSRYRARVALRALERAAGRDADADGKIVARLVTPCLEETTLQEAGRRDLRQRAVFET
jgi:hypothetical protein